MSTLRKRLDDVASKLKEALADIDIAKKNGMGMNRYSMIGHALTDAHLLLYKLGEDVDIYGAKKREREAAAKKAASQRLPSPTHVDKPRKLTHSRVIQTQFLLPGPVNGGGH